MSSRWKCNDESSDNGENTTDPTRPSVEEEDGSKSNEGDGGRSSRSRYWYERHLEACFHRNSLGVSTRFVGRNDSDATPVADIAVALTPLCTFLVCSSADDAMSTTSNKLLVWKCEPPLEANDSRHKLARHFGRLLQLELLPAPSPAARASPSLRTLSTALSISKAFARKSASLVSNVMIKLDLLDHADLAPHTEHSGHDDASSCRAGKTPNGGFLDLGPDDLASLHSSKQPSRSYIDETDLIFHVDLVLECCAALLQFIRMLSHDADAPWEEDQITHSAHGETHFGLIAFRFGIRSTRTFAGICRLASAHFTGTSPLDDRGQGSTDSTHNNNVRHIAQRLLSVLTPSHLDLLALVLVYSGYASLTSTASTTPSTTMPSTDTVSAASHIREDIIVIYPYGGVLETTPNNFIHAAIFQMSSTKINLEKRLESLQTTASSLQSSALLANNKNLKPQALHYMKRRKLVLTEIERTQTTILNLDKGLTTLRQSQFNAQSLTSFSVLKRAMQTVRAQGGLGSVQDAEEAWDELEEEQKELNLIQDALAGPQVEVDEEELEREFARLEIQMQQESATRQDDKSHANKKSMVSSVENLPLAQSGLFATQADEPLPKPPTKTKAVAPKKPNKVSAVTRSTSNNAKVVLF